MIGRVKSQEIRQNGNEKEESTKLGHVVIVVENWVDVEVNTWHHALRLIAVTVHAHTLRVPITANEALSQAYVLGDKTSMSEEIMSIRSTKERKSDSGATAFLSLPSYCSPHQCAYGSWAVVLGPSSCQRFAGPLFVQQSDLLCSVSIEQLHPCCLRPRTDLGNLFRLRRNVPITTDAMFAMCT